MNARAVLDNLPYLLWGDFPDGPLAGAALTLVLASVSAVASGALGLAGGIALAMLAGPARWALTLLIGFFRAIPVLMLIFWTYFLLPILFGVNVPGLATVACALALIGGAYLSHTVHAGIRGVGVAQWQAGMSLGLTRVQTLRHVVLPQALRIMTPSFINQWVSLVKDTSLAYIVGVAELSFVATQVNSRLMVYPAEVFAFVALIYFVMCSVLAWLCTTLLGKPPRPHARQDAATQTTRPRTRPRQGWRRLVATRASGLPGLQEIAKRHRARRAAGELAEREPRPDFSHDWPG
ncbi:amino acid ABC transporter permease [Pandoraea nosoerga]|uniref:Polar amino acid ABC transporter permease n=1 Tax=Pandoraea nosoerga TaxID=2508296 RepID=A0A5E4W8A4_9BURK|nr:amino acid ABC transporter permease [Pandoraea nosoerga]MBN4676006.1 amino acid ABC transporter permease [Pandoraea nosoerga]MBN4682101.1 amino acid ABC transporter permease [Pandoraea nosoerga]MBN4747199.1 amino acid ABC transporter permease [Pandoraea nosoerga]VVE20109.1 polar amino acid ABC transporter permease [Pandoraea nosoerga]